MGKWSTLKVQVVWCKFRHESNASQDILNHLQRRCSSKLKARSFLHRWPYSGHSLILVKFSGSNLHLCSPCYKIHEALTCHLHWRLQCHCKWQWSWCGVCFWLKEWWYHGQVENGSRWMDPDSHSEFKTKLFHFWKVTKEGYRHEWNLYSPRSKVVRHLWKKWNLRLGKKYR